MQLRRMAVQLHDTAAADRDVSVVLRCDLHFTAAMNDDLGRSGREALQFRFARTRNIERDNLHGAARDNMAASRDAQLQFLLVDTR
jgi:hypothetical protein